MKIKFLYADSLDYIDPEFNFMTDSHSEIRKPYWDDQYAHEYMAKTPYDGLLISRALVGDSSVISGSKYSETQKMRFLRVGAREFIRFNQASNIKKPIFGDCGAFSYSKAKLPPYKPEDTVDFYGDGQFTHGCSTDHIIFEFDVNNQSSKSEIEESNERYEITLENASEFITQSKTLGKEFTPIGVVQGWSPTSMAAAAKKLVKMGYKYLAIGGLVPLKPVEIHIALTAVEDAVKEHQDVKIHLLGFAKADHLNEFKKYNHLASFDSTSPLLKAFKDGTRNYFLPSTDGHKLNYLTALRIPQALDNARLKNHIKKGNYSLEELLRLEKNALESVRSIDRDNGDITETTNHLIAYSRPLINTGATSEEALKSQLHNLRMKYEHTLTSRAWKSCDCTVCVKAGIEAIIFRGSNRNKRRGFHNLHVFNNHIKNTINS